VGETLYSAVLAAGVLATGHLTAEIHPELTPQPGDVVVTKQRVSAFTGTNLDVILRSNNIEMLLLTGILTRTRQVPQKLMSQRASLVEQQSEDASVPV